MGYDKNYNIVCPHMDFTKIGRNKIERSMTDKVQKIREEVEKLIYGFNLEADIASCEDAEAEKFADIKYQLCKKILDYIDEVQKEPVSEKKCIFTKDNYTDEDRKVLCEDCKEKCEYSKKEEPVREDFEKALARDWQDYNDRGAATVDALEDNTQELAFAKGFYRGAKWQKAKDQETIETAIHHAYHNGRLEMKEQMMAKAIDGIITNAGGTFGYDVASFKFDDNHSFQVLLPTDKKSKFGDKVKVIVIKED